MLVNLAAAIKLRGKKQWRLGADCGLSPSQFSAVLNQRRAADPWLREKLAQLLNADAEWLFRSCDEIPSPNLGNEALQREPAQTQERR